MQAVMLDWNGQPLWLHYILICWARLAVNDEYNTEEWELSLLKVKVFYHNQRIATTPKPNDARLVRYSVYMLSCKINCCHWVADNFQNVRVVECKADFVFWPSFSTSPLQTAQILSQVLYGWVPTIAFLLKLLSSAVHISHGTFLPWWKGWLMHVLIVCRPHDWKQQRPSGKWQQWQWLRHKQQRSALVSRMHTWSFELHVPSIFWESWWC